MKSDKVLVASGFVVISLIWGSTWLAIKIGLESIPPFYGVALRFSVAMVVLFVIMKIRREKLLLDRQSLLAYTVLGVLSFSFPFALVYWGEQYIASGLASILFAAYPFVVALWSHFLLPTERLTIFKVIGILLGFAGIIIIFWSDVSLRDPQGLWGMVAILISVLLQGTSLVVTKRIGHHVSPVSLSFGGMIIGTTILYIIAFLFEHNATLTFDDKGIGSILYLGIFGTVVTFIIYYWLLKRVEAVFLSLVSLVTPVLAVILGALLLDETLPPDVYLGSSLVLLGIMVANGREIQSYVVRRKLSSTSEA